MGPGGTVRNKKIEIERDEEELAKYATRLRMG